MVSPPSPLSDSAAASAEHHLTIGIRVRVQPIHGRTLPVADQMPVERERVTAREMRGPRKRRRIPEGAFVPDAGRRVIAPRRLGLRQIPTREAMPAILVAPADRIVQRRQLAPGVLDRMGRDALRRVALRAVTDTPGAR